MDAAEAMERCMDDAREKTEDLARLIIAMLDQQKKSEERLRSTLGSSKYFKYRTREDLIESKRLEGELRKAAEEVLGDG